MDQAINGAMGERGLARAMLRLAARHALRAVGRVEPNPLVGCVLARPGSGLDGREVVAVGHHRRFGGPHAEVEAIGAAREAGRDVRGCTAFVTLEPCNAPGRNGACVDALLEAGIARVVYAASDDSPGKGGGAGRLRASGVACELSDACPEATHLSRAWRVRREHGRPFVIVKVAQTIDGKMATLDGHSRWISGERSRRRVHRVRGCVDAIITGRGTVLGDDPHLTARDVPVRRRAVRIVLGMSEGELAGYALAGGLGTAGDGGGVPATLCVPTRSGAALRPVLEALGASGASTVLVEGGPKLAGAFIAQGLADELHVYTGAVLLGGAGHSIDGQGKDVIGQGTRWRLLWTRPSGRDVLSVWVPGAGGVTG
jgi:diaminohydroxyphosphoribosylaminopyrimidine deaminase/5-amino-6-(5-phosphoribosylamino)uracil reductase